VEVRHTLFSRDRGKVLADLWIRCWAGEDAAAERSKIQAAPTHHNSASAPGGDLPNRRAGQIDKIGHIDGLIRRSNIYQMIRDASPVHRRRLRSADVHPAENLARVRIHNLSVETLSDLYRERGLARTRRPDDEADTSGICDLHRFRRRRDLNSPAHRLNIRSICPRANRM